MIKKILIILMLIIFNANLIAQMKPLNVVSASDNARCELNNLFIDSLIIEAHKEDAQIFIISKRAKNERGGVDWVRLRYVKTVISKFKRFNEDKVTIAVGEKNDESEGKIEFWVGKRLFLVSQILKNQQICLVTNEY